MAGPIRIAVLADAGQARRELSGVAAATSSLGSKLGSLGRIATATAAGGLIVAGAAAVRLGKDAVSAASDLGESANAVRVTFGDTAKEIRQLSNASAETVGLSKADFNSLAVQFSAFATTVAGKGGDVGDVMDDLTTRGADFASVMNLEVNEAMGLFQSGLAGETEPLRKFGIDLSAAAVEAHAYKEGIAAAGEELTEQQKVQSRYSLLMQETAKTQGDFKNTSDSLANTQRRLSAQWENAEAKLGKGLMPIVEDATGFILDKGIPAFNDFADWFTDTGAPALGDFIDEARPVVNDMLPGIADGLGQVKDIAKDLAPLVGDVVGAFADMPDWAQKAIVGGGLAAVAGSKLGLGGLLRSGGPGGGGGVGSLFSKATPMPVFVTNPGFGTPTSTTPGKSTGGPPVVPLPGEKPTTSTPAGKGGFWSKAGGLAKGLGSFLAFDFPLPALGSWVGELEGIPPKLDDVNQALLDIAVASTGGEYKDLDTTFKQLDDTFDALKPPQALNKLDQLAKASGVSLEDLMGILPDTAARIDKAGLAASDASKRTGDWRDTITELGRETDRVDGKKPDVPWDFPGLFSGIDTTGTLGRETDKVGSKKPAIPWSFPNLTAGLFNVQALGRGIAGLPDHKTITITTFHNDTYGGLAGGGGHEPKDSSGADVPRVAPKTPGHPDTTPRYSVQKMRADMGKSIAPTPKSASGGGVLRIKGTLDTPFGPAEVRGIAQEEARAEVQWHAGRAAWVNNSYSVQTD